MKNINLTTIRRYYTYVVFALAIPLGTAAFIIELNKHQQMKEDIEQQKLITEEQIKQFEAENAIFDTKHNLDTIQVTLDRMNNKLDSLK